MKHKRCILFLFLFLCLRFSYAQQKDPHQLLKQVSKKYRSMPALLLRFSYAIHQAGLDFSDQVQGSALIQQDMYKIDIGDQRIGCDGSSTWTYIPELNEVTITKTSPENSLNLDILFNLYQEKYNYRSLGTQGTRSTIELTPKDKEEELFKIQVHMNTSSVHLEQVKLFYKDGSRYTYVIKGIEEQPLQPEASFRFQSERGQQVEVIDLR